MNFITIALPKQTIFILHGSSLLAKEEDAISISIPTAAPSCKQMQTGIPGLQTYLLCTVFYLLNSSLFGESFQLFQSFANKPCFVYVTSKPLLNFNLNTISAQTKKFLKFP